MRISLSVYRLHWLLRISVLLCDHSYTQSMLEEKSQTGNLPSHSDAILRDRANAGVQL